MHLWIDGQCFQTGSKYRGIGRYVYELLLAIKVYHPDVKMSISFNARWTEETIEARQIVADIFSPEDIYVWHGSVTAGEVLLGYTDEHRLDENALVHHVNCIAPDLALSVSPFEGAHEEVATPLLPHPALKMPVSGIFYDAIPLRYPDQYLPNEAWKNFFNRRLEAHRGFDSVLCISDFTKTELRDLINHSVSTSISAGVSSSLLSILQEKDLSVPVLDFDYFLYVGASDWRKNVNLIIESFALLPVNLKRDVRFVLAGTQDEASQTALKASWKRKGLPVSQLVFLGQVDDETLLRLYTHAKALIQPTFMEGFGLPTLEALTSGAVVLASNAGAIPEVVGAEEFLFDPKSSQELADKMEVALQDPKFKTLQLSKTSDHIKQFSWERSANKAIEFLTETLIKETRKKNAPSLQSLRVELTSIVRNLNIEIDQKAKILALAELPKKESPRVVIDATATKRFDHKSGIQRVVRNICERLGEGKGKDYSTIVTYSDSPLGRYEIKRDLAGEVEFIPDNKVMPRPSDTLFMVDSSWDVNEAQAPYFHQSRVLGGEIYTGVYDLVPLRSYAFCDAGMPPCFAAWMRQSLKYSTGFISCGSRAVADELYAMLEAIKFPREMKIGHFQLGANFALNKSIQSLAETKKTEKPRVFLMVGTLEPRKNQRTVVDAFEKLWASGSTAELVLVGKPGWENEHFIRRVESHLELGKRLHWHKFVTDEELNQLYIESDALLMPSYAEGFGLPIVESAQYGKTVIASDIPVFREVADCAIEALFFDLDSVDSLVTILRKFIAKPTVELKEGASTIHVKSWADATCELEQVLRNEKWYRIYLPEPSNVSTDIDNIGKFIPSLLPSTDATLAKIDIVEPLFEIESSDRLKAIVKVTNCSDIVWSNEGEYRVFFKLQLLDTDGTTINRDLPEITIPFVLIPDDFHYVPVYVPNALVTSNVASLKFEVVQDNSRPISASCILKIDRDV